jgi:dihydroorotate dehydrogenase (NAD+) catalytic subunit
MAMDSKTDPRLRIDFCGLDFATPLVLLSGCVGFGEEYTRIQGFSNREAGAIQRVDEYIAFAFGGAVAGVHSPCLPVTTVGTA